MAHECPECGQICYCGGDMDDMLLNNDDEIEACNHWEQCASDPEYDDYLWGDEED